MMIETERLRLLPWRAEDWESFAPIAKDPEMMRFITHGVPWSDERIQHLIERQRAYHESHGYCRWRLELRESGETAGFCGAAGLQGLDEPEMGWWVARKLWRRGLATEAARAALDDLFTRVGLERIVSVIAIGNAASVRVAEKLGYHYLRDAVINNFDVRVYEKLR